MAEVLGIRRSGSAELAIHLHIVVLERVSLCLALPLGKDVDGGLTKKLFHLEARTLD
jgi:hypothetical protein